VLANVGQAGPAVPAQHGRFALCCCSCQVSHARRCQTGAISTHWPLPSLTATSPHLLDSHARQQLDLPGLPGAARGDRLLQLVVGCSPPVPATGFSSRGPSKKRSR
jgi:hypothetical protein